ncbi:MAG TPA: VanZ family protein [Gemmataceae bacterium]|nr:VanZ family protein [Gemmataceae bacterium]
MTLRTRRIAWIAFTVLWTVALTAPIGKIEAFRSNSLLEGEVRIVVAKILHALAYASWTILTASLLPSFGGRIGLLFCLMTHAVCTEYVQLRWSGRDGCLRDVLIDHAGILVGLVLSWKWWTGPTK